MNAIKRGDLVRITDGCYRGWRGRYLRPAPQKGMGTSRILINDPEANGRGFIYVIDEYFELETLEIMNAKYAVNERVYVSDTPYSVQDVRWNGGEWEYALKGWFASQYFPEHMLLSENEHRALVARVEASIERNKQHRLMVLERMKREGK